MQSNHETGESATSDSSTSTETSDSSNSNSSNSSNNKRKNPLFLALVKKWSAHQGYKYKHNPQHKYPTPNLFHNPKTKRRIRTKNETNETNETNEKMKKIDLCQYI